MMELGIEPTVVLTRRLGNDTNRVRPLLVSLPTEEDVLAMGVASNRQKEATASSWNLPNKKRPG